LTGLGLRFQVLISGFVVMALELVGSRLITPVFGNSIFTWGSLIGVVLAGLASGYEYGGKLADRSPSRLKFSSIIFTGGLLVVLVPFIAPFALEMPLTLGLGDRYGPLLSSILILGPSTVTLGIISPYAVKIATQSLSQLGNVAGNLYSLSTVGSIAGAFGATFVLIPFLDIRGIIFGLGLTLMLVSLIWLPRFTIMLVAIIILLLFTTFSASASRILAHSGNVVYEKETPYSHLDVVDMGDRRTLYLNGLPHSAMDLTDPIRLIFTYTRYFHMGFLINPEAKNVLFIGGGGFSGPKNFLASYPNVFVDVAEIDPDVIRTAQDYFAVKPDQRLNSFNVDGRIYLTQTDKLYDVIILDAYAKTYVPFHLMTAEFMNLLYSRLTPEGVVISNLIGSLVGDTSDLIRSEYKTARSVFPNVSVFATGDVGIAAVQNIILMFAKSPNLDLTMLLKSEVNNGTNFLNHLYLEPISIEDVPLLTDNYAPVERLLNPVTGRPYVIEQQFGRLAPIAQVAEGSASLTFTALILITVAWFVYLFRRWY
jgi:spermidine synthase